MKQDDYWRDVEGEPIVEHDTRSSRYSAIQQLTPIAGRLNNVLNTLRYLALDKGRYDMDDQVVVDSIKEAKKSIEFAIHILTERSKA